MFFWIFPAIRQYKSNLFWYFLLYAIHDPIAALYFHFTGRTEEGIGIVFNLLLLLSISWGYRDKNFIKFLLAAAFLVSFISLFSTRHFVLYTNLLIHSILFFLFMLRTLSFVAVNGGLNIFHLFLLLEEISIFLKFFVLLFELKTEMAFFITTTAFEILIALFFSFYREDNKKLLVTLKEN